MALTYPGKYVSASKLNNVSKFCRDGGKQKYSCEFVRLEAADDSDTQGIQCPAEKERGTLHLHMLVWVKDLTKIRANLLHASILWENADDAFVVADTQKSARSCLPLQPNADSFVQQPDGRQLLEFMYTEEDARRNIWAYVSTLLGALRCRTDLQLADGKSMLQKYVSSYVTKMQIAQAFTSNPDTSIMTVSRATVQRVNTIVVKKLFPGQEPLCDVPCAAVADGPEIFLYRGMRIVITENWDKAS
ncbi:hypothetical protein ACROYT_G014544 [Oculina patagonica]